MKIPIKRKLHSNWVTEQYLKGKWRLLSSHICLPENNKEIYKQQRLSTSWTKLGVKEIKWRIWTLKNLQNKNEDEACATSLHCKENKKR